jgi:hypothetical protein
MNDRAILHVDLVAHANGIDIATNHGIEPETAIIAGDHVTDDRGIGSDIAVVSESWQNAMYRKDDGHKNYVYFPLIEVTK